MSYETFCQYLEHLGISLEDIKRHTSLSLKDHLPFYEDPGGTTITPHSKTQLIKENLFNEVTLITFTMSS